MSRSLAFAALSRTRGIRVCGLALAPMQPFPTALALLFAAGATLSACSDPGWSSGPVAPSATARVSTEVSVEESDVDPGGKAYTTIDIPGGTFQGPLDINDRGVMVGRYRSISDGRTRGYRRSETGEFATIEYPGAVFTVAGAINNRGDIVGHYALPTSPNVRHGFLLRNGVFTSFDPPGSIWTNTLGINDRGDIVGRFCVRAPCRAPGNGDYRGFLLRAGRFTTIEYPGANETNLWDVNRREEIVGGFGTVDGKTHLFVLREGGFTPIELPGVVDINPDKGGINSRGDIVGVYCDVAPCHIGPQGTHGFLLGRNGLTTIDFPEAPSTIAFGINDRRDIVGWYFDTKGEAHGFLLSGRRRDAHND
jgi:hypothetical protein